MAVGFGRGLASGCADRDALVYGVGHAWDASVFLLRVDMQRRRWKERIYGCCKRRVFDEAQRMTIEMPLRHPFQLTSCCCGMSIGYILPYL